MHTESDVMARCDGDGSSFFQHELFASEHNHNTASGQDGSILFPS